MAITVSWDNSAPTVDSWSGYFYTEAHHQESSNYNRYTRARFRVGIISGTRNLAVHCTAQGKKASGWMDQYVFTTIGIVVNGQAYSGKYCEGTVDAYGSNWDNIGTVYATISGANHSAGLLGSSSTGSKTVELPNPLTGPNIKLFISGVWVDADVVHINVNGEWITADSAFVYTDGNWEES